MTLEEKLDRLLVGQARLYWLLTSVPGVACYSKDVTWFAENTVNFGGGDDTNLTNLVNGYRGDKEPALTTLKFEGE